MGIFGKKDEEKARKEKIEKLERKLKKLLAKLTKKGSAKQILWKIILNINLEISLRKIAVSQFLEQKDLTPADYESLLLELGDDFGPEKEVVGKEFREIAAPSDVYDAIRCEDEYLSQLGWAEFLYRIQKGLIRKGYDKWVSFQTIIHKNELREPAWKIFKQLVKEDLSLEDVKDLQAIIDLNFTPTITAEAQTLVRKIQERFTKVQESNKTIAEIEKTIKEIQELKRGQE